MCAGIPVHRVRCPTLKLAITSHALYERLDFSVEPGNGATDLASEDNYVALGITADSTADFTVRGADVTGAAGETVTAELRFRNKGPGWFGNLGSGDPAGVIDFTVPEGTTVNGVPSGCFPQQACAPSYSCSLPYWVTESAERSYAFQLRVDSVIEDATGQVVVRPEWGDSFRFDPKSKNNRAQVVVNAAP